MSRLEHFGSRLITVKLSGVETQPTDEELSAGLDIVLRALERCSIAQLRRNLEDIERLAHREHCDAYRVAQRFMFLARNCVSTDDILLDLLYDCLDMAEVEVS